MIFKVYISLNAKNNSKTMTDNRSSEYPYSNGFKFSTACFSGDIQLVKIMLLQYKIDEYYLDKGLRFAFWKKNRELVALLLSHDVDFSNYTDNNIFHNDCDLLFLLNNGATYETLSKIPGKAEKVMNLNKICQNYQSLRRAYYQSQNSTIM
jgi:hypothetical protein